MSNKVAIVCGGSKGLGYACAEELLRNYFSVLICSRNRDGLEKASQTLSELGDVDCLVADMSEKSAPEKVVEYSLKQYGRIDALVNNSGGPKVGRFRSLSVEDWELGFRSTLMYMIELTTLCSSEMKKNSWGRIINIASIVAKEPNADLLLSSVFRAGVISFAKAVSKELYEEGITINTVCPGAFYTNRAKELIAKTSESRGIPFDDIYRENVAKLPGKRYQDVSELAHLVSYLCSDNARSITGTTINIDAGISSAV